MTPNNVTSTILNELRQHLVCAAEWAHPADIFPHPGDGITPAGWTCVGSILEAVEDGNVGLALTRWDDLMQAPVLSDIAQSWRCT